MISKRKEQIHARLKGIETGDPASVEVVNPNKYIQHNPQTQEGGEGLASLFKRLSKTDPSVEIVRIFEDGDFVFAHTIYDFSSTKIGFEVFRFEDGLVVEHWDNIQEKQGPNQFGQSMVSGPVEVTELDLTESNRELVRTFVTEFLIHRRSEEFERYVERTNYTEHSPKMDIVDKAQTMEYTHTHRLLAEGNFVLTVSEGKNNGLRSSFYDLFRVAEGKIVEHWDTLEKVPPQSEWKNDNGKF